MIYSSSFGIKHKSTHGLSTWRHTHLIQQVSLCPPLVQSVRLLSFKYRGVAMLIGFPRTRWPRLRFSESYAVRISVKISRICEFRVIMGIMTGLLGCCSSSTLGSRANDYVKTLATLGFWLHHSPCSLGCWTNNTLAARSLSPKYTCIEREHPSKYVTRLRFPLFSVICFRSILNLSLEYYFTSTKTMGRTKWNTI